MQNDFIYASENIKLNEEIGIACIHMYNNKVNCNNSINNNNNNLKI